SDRDWSSDVCSSDLDAAQAFQAKMLKEIPAREQADLKTLEQQHKIKLYKANPADVAKLRKMMEPYWDEWAKQGGPKTIEAVAMEIGRASCRERVEVA